MTTMPIAGERQAISRAPNALERAGRRALHAMVRRITRGQLTLEDAAGVLTGGDGIGGPRVSVRVHDPSFYRSVLLNGSAGAADAFIRADWTTDDLAGLFELLLINRDALDAARSPVTRIAAGLARTTIALTRNSRSGSRRNIASHYDLSNEFFALWLDPTMLYSSAYFERPDMTLEEAQLAKVDRCCTKLDLKPTDRLLEIGTGWGAAAIRAAEKFGCRVVTTTISERQFEFAAARVRDKGLQDRVSVVKLDYRDLERELGTGCFDKVLSIEMIEAVGHEYIPAYFRTLSRMLKPNGMAMIQGIWIRDQRYESARRTVDFLKRHIFPGSCLLGLTTIARALKSHTDLSIVHMDDMAPHYVRTLRCWNDAFHAKLDEVRSLGFDERFIRTWRYYLEYCEGAFRARHCGDYQFLLTKPLARPSIESPTPA